MEQKIFKGLEELIIVLRQYKKIFLIHGKSFEQYSEKRLFERIPKIEFMEFSSNPLYEEAYNGVELFNKGNCDAIVAVGGGSAIDVAKCIKLFCKMSKKVNYLQQEKADTGIPIIAIPTTAGTGSESTQHAVLYDKGEKQSISHFSIVPDYVFLEPSLLKNLSIYQKKCTMMDALCQAIESWWSVHSTEESRAYSIKAIVEIKENWREYIFKNTHKAAERILDAANYSGRAINITATTAAHAMSYKITSLYKIPHGHAVAICLPEVWKYMLEHTESCVDKRGERYFKNILNEISDKLSLDYFESMLNELGFEYPKAISKASEVKLLVQSVNPIRLKNNPVELTAEILKEMYGRLLR